MPGKKLDVDTGEFLRALALLTFAVLFVLGWIILFIYAVAIVLQAAFN